MANVVEPRRSRLCDAVASLSPNMKAAILGAVVVVLLAVFGGFYSLGYSLGAKDLEAVNDFKKLELPALMGDLRTLAKDFSDRATLDARNQELSKATAEKDIELQKLRSDIEKAHTETAALQKRVGELGDQISAIFPADEIKMNVKEGTAASVLSGQITIGVTRILGSEMLLRINGLSKDLEVGAIDPVLVGDRQCHIKVMRIGDKEADFLVSCGPLK
jgi:hypothetical protein